LIVLSEIPGQMQDDERFFDGLVNKLRPAAQGKNCELEPVKIYRRDNAFYIELHDRELQRVSADIFIYFGHASPRLITTETWYYLNRARLKPDVVENEFDAGSPEKSLEDTIEKARKLYKERSGK